MINDSAERLFKNYYNARKTWEAWCFMNNIHLNPEKPEIKKTIEQNELLEYSRFVFLKDLHIGFVASVKFHQV